MTNPSDAQRPRWVKERLTDDAIAEIKSGVSVLPWALRDGYSRFALCWAEVDADKIIALEADLGRAREESSDLRDQNILWNEWMAEIQEKLRLAEGKAALADEAQALMDGWRTPFVIGDGSADAEAEYERGTQRLVTATKDWLRRFSLLTPAADAPIAHSRSQAKRLTVQTGIKHIAAANAAEGGKE